MNSQSENPLIVDGIELTPSFNFRDLSFAIRHSPDNAISARCDCCSLADVYNGIGSGPLLFICPKGCSCHD